MWLKRYLSASDEPTRPSWFPHVQINRSSRLLAGLLLSSGIGLLAYRRRSLTRSGIAGAVVTGSTTFGLGGTSWGLTLIFFFLSSSFFSHFRAREKERTAAEKFSKGSQRDLAQVAANGGVASALALGNGISTHAPLRVRGILQAGYVGALATATADTWATELGVLSRQQPRLITTGQPTTPGTSGGITLHGTTAAAIGALALGLFFRLVNRRTPNVLPLIALFSGLAGSLIDSLLGATLQTTYYCHRCNQETERRVHACGTTTVQVRGIAWMNNDAVNFLSTLAGALLAMLLQRALPDHRHRA